MGAVVGAGLTVAAAVVGAMQTGFFMATVAVGIAGAGIWLSGTAAGGAVMDGAIGAARVATETGGNTSAWGPKVVATGMLAVCSCCGVDCHRLA